MTAEQKNQIWNLRGKGLGYAMIADKLGLTKNQVSAYCNRNGLDEKMGDIEFLGDFCRNCGKPLMHTAGKKKRNFCNRECRLAWWNANPEKINRKAIYSYICPVCGKKFTAYGNAHRIYCSRECSRFARYGHV